MWQIFVASFSVCNTMWVRLILYIHPLLPPGTVNHFRRFPGEMWELAASINIYDSAGTQLPLQLQRHCFSLSVGRHYFLDRGGTVFLAVLCMDTVPLEHNSYSPPGHGKLCQGGLPPVIGYIIMSSRLRGGRGNKIYNTQKI